MQTDILRSQYAIYHGLLSCDLFDGINVVLERDFLSQGVVDYAAIWQTPRNGFCGAGLLVEVPTLELPKPNSLQRNLIFSVVALEERNINLTSSTVVSSGGDDVTVQGTGKTAEEWGELVLDFLYGWLLGNTSGLTPDTKALERAKDFVDIMGMRASVSLRQEHHAIARVSQPTITSSSLTVTLASATPGAEIRYTTDGFSFPGPGNDGSLPGTQAAVQYTGPFTVTSGVVVQACAFLDGSMPSHVSAASIT
jgi:hypothetical protein